MPKTKTTAPAPSREKGQRSKDLPAYLTRWLPQWRQPEWFNADGWRTAVVNQPIATVCRETLIANIIALDWKIEPRDSTQRDEHSKDIEYYTKFFEQGSNGFDYTEIIEFVMKDYLDIPFGSGTELGWENDTPPDENNANKLIWIKPLDGGTLFPSLNDDWPVGQALKEYAFQPVFFPKHAINRLYMSPRTDMYRWGWGIAPPEKIYLALNLLVRGDQYYANLLLDTPEVGILDLGDMAKDSAEQWVGSWKDLLAGVDPFKIPVLYEHETQAKFVSFTRPPTEMMFDRATSKYASIICAGYGLTLSDIGVSATNSSGETLAGSIRQERKTKRTGMARAKSKLKLFFDRMLPPWLEFKFIDLDDELSVALGRARLANSTAFTAYIKAGVFTAEEVRQQTIADGLISISIPEKLPEEAKKMADANMEAPERPGMLGKPVAPSDGGHGEVVPKSLLDVALATDDEFRGRYNELESAYEEMSEEEQEESIVEIQNFLSKYQELETLLDTDGQVDDNIEEINLVEDVENG